MPHKKTCNKFQVVSKKTRKRKTTVNTRVIYSNKKDNMKQLKEVGSTKGEKIYICITTRGCSRSIEDFNSCHYRISTIRKGRKRWRSGRRVSDFGFWLFRLCENCI